MIPHPITEIKYGDTFTKRIFGELTFTEEDLFVKVFMPEQETQHENGVWVDDFQYIRETPDGNIIITPFTLNYWVKQRWVPKTKGAKNGGQKLETYEIIRYSEKVGDMRYRNPKGFGSMPFFPKGLVKKYNEGAKISTLIITEGYFKAMRAEKAGLDVVALPGITVMSDAAEDNGALFSDILALIKQCDVQNVIILWDGDCRNISEKALYSFNPLTKRPMGFVKAAVKIQENLKDTWVDIYFARVISEFFEAKPKGLDDLLNTAEELRITEKVIEELLGFKTTFPRYVHKINISVGAEGKLKEYFQLTEVDKFYSLHRDMIGSLKFQWFGKSIYQYDTEQEKCMDIFIPNLPKEVDVHEYLRYAFYTHRKKYWVLDKGQPVEVSNFTMNVEYLIRSKKAPKRIISIKNDTGDSIVVDFDMESLVSITKFKQVVEGYGNFVCGEMKQQYLDRIKKKLYAEEINCVEINTLGQHKAGFWAWSNGLSTDEGFKPVNSYGIVEHNNVNYYIPALSAAYAEEEADYESERKFKFYDGVSFEKWNDLVVKTYGENGKIGIAFWLSAIFVDIITKRTKQFPMLFCFGKKGSGKSSMIETLMYSFGDAQKEISLENKSTAKGLSRKLAQFRNALVWIDEYKSHLDKDLVGTLKGIADRSGYTKAKTSNDTQTSSMPILSSAVIGGQDMPVNEPALFSRCILTQFSGQNFENSEKSFVQLLDMAATGLSSVTTEIASYRQLVSDCFPQFYKKAKEDMREHFKKIEKSILDRQLSFYSILIAMVDIFFYQIKYKGGEDNAIGLAFSPIDFTTLCYRLAEKQALLMENANEAKIFWDVFAYMMSQGIIKNNLDYAFKGDLICIRLATVHPIYMETHRRQKGINGMEKGTLSEYFKSEPSFDGIKEMRFKGVKSVTALYTFKISLIKEQGVDLIACIPDSEEEDADLGNN